MQRRQPSGPRGLGPPSPTARRRHRHSRLRDTCGSARASRVGDLRRQIGAELARSSARPIAGVASAGPVPKFAVVAFTTDGPDRRLRSGSRGEVPAQLSGRDRSRARRSSSGSTRSSPTSRTRPRSSRSTTCVCFSASGESTSSSGRSISPAWSHAWRTRSGGREDFVRGGSRRTGWRPTSQDRYETTRDCRSGSSCGEASRSQACCSCT